MHVYVVSQRATPNLWLLWPGTPTPKYLHLALSTLYNSTSSTADKTVVVLSAVPYVSEQSFVVERPNRSQR